jgi:hypothetical protein
MPRKCAKITFFNRYNITNLTLPYPGIISSEYPGFEARLHCYNRLIQHFFTATPSCSMFERQGYFL